MNKIYYYLFILIILLLIAQYYSYRKFRYGLTTTIKKGNIIRFGQTIDENNSDSINYSEGIILAFQSFNRVSDNKIHLLIYNDRDEKELAINNAKILINYFDVLGIVGTWGATSTIGVLNNVTKNKNIPLIGPYTGSPIIRRLYNKNLILVQGYALDEFKMMIKHMELNNINNISFIYQNDDYGLSYFNYFSSYLTTKNIDINIISSGTYERNSNYLYECFKNVLNVDEPYDYNSYQYNETLNSIEAVIIICSEIQIVNIINFLKKIKPKLFIYFCSFTTTNPNILKNIINKKNIYQTLLNYDIKKIPMLYKKFNDELKYYNKHEQKQIKTITHCTYQGFYTGLLITKALETIDDFSSINRKSFIDIFYKNKYFDIYGLYIGPFTNLSNSGVDYVSFNTLNNNGEIKFLFDNKI